MEPRRSLSDDENGSDTNPLLNECEKGERSTVRIKGSSSENKKRWCVYTIILVLMATVVAMLALMVTMAPTMAGSAMIMNLPVPYSSTKHFKHAAVAADAAQCSTIGKNFLENPKASVVDAAIGTLLCLGIHSAHSCGVGGGFFMTVYAAPNNGSTRKEMITLDSREVAPDKATKDMFMHGGSAYLGGKSIAVPAEIKGYHEAWKKFGRLPWRELFQPAIKLCRDGYIIDPALGDRLQQSKLIVLKDPGLREVFAPHGSVLKAGEKAYRPKLADTLETIAEQGAEAYYDGSLTKDILDDLKDAKSIITQEDLKHYQAEWRTPVRSTIKSKKWQLNTMPPPSGAAILPFILNIMDGYTWSPKNLTNIKQTVTTYQRLTEAYKFAHAQKSYLGDPQFVSNIDQVVEQLESTTFADKTRAKISDHQTHDVEWYKPAWKPWHDHGTSHMSILAPDGSAVAATSTINNIFGSGIRGLRTGIIFNDEMADFDNPNTHHSEGFTPSPANMIQPGKRPLSSMSPTIILDENDNVVAVTGASGGSKIPTATSFVLFHHGWLGMPIGNATDQLRLHHTLLPNYIHVEKNFNKTMTRGLEKIGHEVRELDDYAVVQTILRRCNDSQCKKAELTAVSDRRKAGIPDGF